MFSATLQRRRLLVLSGIGLLAALSGCTTVDIFGDDSDFAEDKTDAALPLTNAVRAGSGLDPLSGDKSAQGAAMTQARRMARAGKMSHLIGFNDSFLTRMKSAKVPLPAAENIAVGQEETERAVHAWVVSQKHLKNMLGDYRGLGVAVARHPASANRPYWAMVLSS
ncbi:MAG: CAP domain-containing protein [Allorhizobium sp.]